MLERRLAGAAAEHEMAALFANVLEAGDSADVHQVAGASQAELEQRQQALSAREDLGLVVAVAAEQRHRLVERLRRVVVKSCGNHHVLLSTSGPRTSR